MMQMVAKGGLPVLTDGQRSADANNPRGYYELELVKSLARNADALSAAEGKAVKVISSLLRSLPPGHEYRVIFMQRPLPEVLASQDRMMQRLGRTVPARATGEVIGAFQQHLRQIHGWLSRQANIKVLRVDYSAVLQDARGQAILICAFLGLDLDVDAMCGQVEQSLHRERVSVVGS